MSEAQAPDNRWGAASLDWRYTSSPPIQHNFEHTPIVTTGPYDFTVLEDWSPTGDAHANGASVKPVRAPARAHE